MPASLVTTTARSLPETWVAVASGVVAVICVSLSTTNRARSPPNVIAVAPVKPLPRIVTRSPPAARHWFGWTPLTVGSLAWSSERTPNRTVGMCSPARRLGPAFVVTNASRSLPEVKRRVGRRRGDLALAVDGEACRDLLRIGPEGDGGHVSEASADDHARSALAGIGPTDTAHRCRRAGNLAWSSERTPNRTVGMCSPARRLGPAFVATNASRSLPEV